MFQSMFAQEALFFTVPALLGTAVFLVQLVLMTVGGDLHHGNAADAAVAGDSGDSTDAFKLLSVQSIAAFLMGFGWGGLGGRVGFDWPMPSSLMLGAGLGVVFVWVLGLLMKTMYGLESSGNVHAGDAVGREGSVYASVPAAKSGRGQVRVVIGQRERIYNAVSDGEALPSGTRVRVTSVNDDQTLCVTRA
jgi:hypothetical protein